MDKRRQSGINSRKYEKRTRELGKTKEIKAIEILNCLLMSKEKKNFQ